MSSRVGQCRSWNSQSTNPAFRLLTSSAAIIHVTLPLARSDSSPLSSSNSIKPGREIYHHQHHSQTSLSSTSFPSRANETPHPDTSLRRLPPNMFRTALLRSARAVRPATASRTFITAAAKQPVRVAAMVPRIQSVQAVRMYSAGGALNQQEVEGRIISLLQGFDKVSFSFPSPSPKWSLWRCHHHHHDD